MTPMPARTRTRDFTCRYRVSAVRLFQPVYYTVFEFLTLPGRPMYTEGFKLPVIHVRALRPRSVAHHNRESVDYSAYA